MSRSLLCRCAAAFAQITPACARESSIRAESATRRGAGVGGAVSRRQSECRGGGAGTGSLKGLPPTAVAPCSRLVAAMLKSLRRLAGVEGEGPSLADEGSNKPIELTLDGVRLVYNEQERRWTSSTSEMFAAATQIHSLVDENDSLHQSVTELEAELEKERVCRAKATAEKAALVVQNEELLARLKEKDEEILAAFATIKQLKTYVTSTAGLPLPP